MMYILKSLFDPRSFLRLEQGTATYGPNMFADVTEEEFKANYLSKIPGAKLTKNMPLAAEILTNPPKDIEWNTKGNLAYLASRPSLVLISLKFATQSIHLPCMRGYMKQGIRGMVLR